MHSVSELIRRPSEAEPQRTTRPDRSWLRPVPTTRTPESTEAPRPFRPSATVVGLGPQDDEPPAAQRNALAPLEPKKPSPTCIGLGPPLGVAPASAPDELEDDERPTLPAGALAAARAPVSNYGPDALPLRNPALWLLLPAALAVLITVLTLLLRASP